MLYSRYIRTYDVPKGCTYICTYVRRYVCTYMSCSVRMCVYHIMGNIRQVKNLWFSWFGREHMHAHTSGSLHCMWYRSGEFMKESTVCQTQYRYIGPY